MPRRGRGGRRTGTPGKAYGQRTDLHGGRQMQFVGQQYGARARQVAEQQAVPATAPPPPATAPPAGPAPSGPGAPPVANPAPGPDPGTLGDLFGPTARPDEPLTAGMPFGPGPGPRVQTPYDPDLDQLRKIYQAYPSNALLAVIDEMENE